VIVLHTSFFYTVSSNSNSLAPTRSKSIYPILGGSKEAKLRGSNIWTVWCGEEQSVWVLWLLPVCSDLCVAVRCGEGGFQQHFVGSSSRESLLRGFERFSVQIWVNGLTTWHIVYRNHPSGIQNTMAMNPWLFPAEGVAMNFFRGEPGWCQPTVLLSAVHPQWRSVTKSFHHDPHNRRANLNTPLTVQFCDMRLSFL